MKYKGMIFDYDYTLGDCTDGIAQCVNFGLNQMGLEAAEIESIRRAVGMTLEDTYSFLTGDQEEDKRKEFTKYFKEKAEEVMVASSRFLPFARETLEMLYCKKIPVGIVTTKENHRIQGILKLHMAQPLVAYICGSDQVTKAKPDPEGLWKVIEDMGLKKEEVLYVGDSVIDAKTAENAGVDFAAVMTGATTREELEAYPHVILMEDIRPILTMI